MSVYVRYAETEFQAANTPEEIRHHVLNLLEIFDQEGHSGMSAGWARAVFSKPAEERPRVEPEEGEEEDELLKTMQDAMDAHIKALDSQLALAPEDLQAEIRRVFCRVGTFEPISPLTGAPEEWMDIGGGEYQNKRCYSVFKEADGRAFFSDGRVWQMPSGARFTDKYSRVELTFPCIPAREFVPISEHPTRSEREILILPFPPSRRE